MPQILPARRSRVNNVFVQLSAFGVLFAPAFDDGGRLKMRRTQPIADPAIAATLTPGAIALLRDTGLFVLDLDRKDGVDGVRWYEREIGALPEVATVSTPRGGLHVWFQGEAKGSNDRIAPGVDVTGNNGNAPVPGAWTRGGGYRLLTGVFTIATPPKRLRELLVEAPPPAPTQLKVAAPQAWASTALRRFSAEILTSRYPETVLNRLAFLAGTRDAFDEEIACETLVDAAMGRGISYARAWSCATRAFTAGRSKR